MKNELRYGRFAIEENGKYVKIRCEREGIYLSFVSAPAEDNCIYLLNSYRDNKMGLPARVMKIYGFGDIEPINITENGEYFIKARNKTGTVPLPYNCQVPKRRKPDIKKAEERKNKKIHLTRISLNDKGNRFANGVIIRFYNKHECYVSITPYNGEDDIPSIGQLRAEYGANLLAYPYETLQYMQNGLPNGEKKCADIIGFILKKMGMQAGDYFRYLEMPDGEVILTAAPKICSIDGNMIEPVEQKPVERVICSECSGDNDIKDLILLFENTLDLCNKVASENRRLAEKVRELQDTILA